MTKLTNEQTAEILANLETIGQLLSDAQAKINTQDDVQYILNDAHEASAVLDRVLDKLEDINDQ